jgi:hypothetical protein
MCLAEMLLARSANAAQGAVVCGAGADVGHGGGGGAGAGTSHSQTGQGVVVGGGEEVSVVVVVVDGDVSGTVGHVLPTDVAVVVVVDVGVAETGQTAEQSRAVVTGLSVDVTDARLVVPGVVPDVVVQVTVGHSGGGQRRSWGKKKPERLIRATRKAKTGTPFPSPAPCRKAEPRGRSTSS